MDLVPCNLAETPAKISMRLIRWKPKPFLYQYRYIINDITPFSKNLLPPITTDLGSRIHFLDSDPDFIFTPTTAG